MLKQTQHTPDLCSLHLQQALRTNSSLAHLCWHRVHWLTEGQHTINFLRERILRCKPKLRLFFFFSLSPEQSEFLMFTSPPPPKCLLHYIHQCRDRTFGKIILSSSPTCDHNLKSRNLLSSCSEEQRAWGEGKLWRLRPGLVPEPAVEVNCAHSLWGIDLAVLSHWSLICLT